MQDALPVWYRGYSTCAKIRWIQTQVCTYVHGLRFLFCKGTANGGKNERRSKSALGWTSAAHPSHEALENFRRMRVVPFDVPGHKRGRGNPELTAFLGQQCVGVDVNSMKPLDNLCHPVSVIREAEELAADAFGAAHAFLMVGGTTSSVQSMVLTACKRGDEIILPRNVHRSVLNALVLCGAVPVYVNPGGGQPPRNPSGA